MTKAFDCPCGHTNYIEGTSEVLKGRVFRCEACKVNVLLKKEREKV